MFVNPSSHHEEEEEEVGRYVTFPTHKKTAASDGGIGELEKEVDEILTQSGSLIEKGKQLQ